MQLIGLNFTRCLLKLCTHTGCHPKTFMYVFIYCTLTGVCSYNESDIGTLYTTWLASLNSPCFFRGRFVKWSFHYLLGDFNWSEGRTRGEPILNLFCSYFFHLAGVQINCIFFFFFILRLLLLLHRTSEMSRRWTRVRKVRNKLYIASERLDYESQIPVRFLYLFHVLVDYSNNSLRKQ